MAKISNITIYRQAADGRRVFRVPAEDVPAVRVGLWRRGYGCRTTRKAGRAVSVEITERVWKTNQ